MTAEEEWRPCVGFPRYEVSSQGRVMSYVRREPRFLKWEVNTEYPRVALGGRKRKVHKLVAEAFLGPCPDGQEVRHLDGNRLNSYVENLRYGTHRENIQDSIRHGTHPMCMGPDLCLKGHRLTEANTYRQSNGGRRCRTCRRAYEQARQPRHRQRSRVAA